VAFKIAADTVRIKVHLRKMLRKTRKSPRILEKVLRNQVLMVILIMSLREVNLDKRRAKERKVISHRKMT
jgi:hypothetical protein